MCFVRSRKDAFGRVKENATLEVHDAQKQVLAKAYPHEQIMMRMHGNGQREKVEVRMAGAAAVRRDGRTLEP